MKVTLFYEGEMPSNGSPEDKMMIRRKLHPQLKRFWETYLRVPHRRLSRDEMLPFSSSFRKLNFVSLGCEKYEHFINLDLFFLKSIPPGGAGARRDLDNQLKTLFDALSAPQNQEMIPKAERGHKGTIYTLVQDDRLIKNFNVKLEELYFPRYSRKLKLIIEARICSYSNFEVNRKLGIVG